MVDCICCTAGMSGAAAAKAKSREWDDGNFTVRLNSTFDFSDPLSFDNLRVWAILFVSGVTRDYIRRKNFPGRLKSRPLDA